MWAYGPADFIDFDDQVVQLLQRGMQLRLATGTLSPLRLVRRSVDLVASVHPRGRNRPSRNRTDVLADLLAAEVFGDKLMPDVTHPGLATVLSATDLITARAVRFGSDVSSLSLHGRIVEPVRVADAVAASAAYPLAFPAVQRTYTFQRANTFHQRRVALTDGGVFDNLGLSVLEPGRDLRYTDHVYPVDYIVAADAGRQEPGDSAARVLPMRIKRSYDITYKKSQDGTRSRLHAAADTGALSGFVHAYLGQRDERLPEPPPNLVPLNRVNNFPTNLRAITDDDLDALTQRGRQLTRLLLNLYIPTLLR
jgi:predicted acylesterase/phospholipase RssA